MTRLPRSDRARTISCATRSSWRRGGSIDHRHGYARRRSASGRGRGDRPHLHAEEEAGGVPARAGRPHRARGPARRGVLARHEAAPPSRARVGRRREGAVPRRADDRDGPARRARVPAARRGAQGRGQDDLADDARHGRGGARLRPGLADRPRAHPRDRDAAFPRHAHLPFPADRRRGRARRAARRAGSARRRRLRQLAARRRGANRGERERRDGRGSAAPGRGGRDISEDVAAEPRGGLRAGNRRARTGDLVRAFLAGARVQLSFIRAYPDALIPFFTAPLFTVIFMMIFRHSGRPDLTGYAAIAPVFIALSWLALFQSGWVIQTDRWSGTIELLVAAPSSFAANVLGRIVATTMLGVISFGEAWLVARLIFGAAVTVHHWWTFLATVVVTLAAMAGTAVVMASLFVLTRSEEHTSE